jgi:hypothetical protein
MPTSARIALAAIAPITVGLALATQAATAAPARAITLSLFTG